MRGEDASTVCCTIVYAKYNSMPLVYAKYGILHNRMPRYGGAWMGYAKSYVGINMTYDIV